jgi:hypothetical protein
MCKDPSAIVRDSDDALKLMKAACAFGKDDPVSLLYRLDESKEAAPLRKVFDGHICFLDN